MEYSSSVRGERLQGMEVFGGVEFVLLRSWEYATYLHAGEDGRSVYHGGLGGGGASRHNAVWAVQPLRVAGPVGPGGPCILLRGAYGRYLGLGDPESCGCGQWRPRWGFEATQRDYERQEVNGIVWRAFRCPPDVVEHRGARGVVRLSDRSWRYLRANVSILGSRGSVSLDTNADDERAALWDVVAVARSPIRPELPIATNSGWAVRFVSACFPRLRRGIRFARADAAVNFGEQEGDWTSFQYRGRSVRLLREELARRVGYDFTLCVLAGRYGHLTPLLIDLPRNRETLHIVLVRPNTRANDQLIFPDPNALSTERSEEGEPMIEGNLVCSGED